MIRGDWRGWPFFVYARLPGRPLRPTEGRRLGQHLGRMLQELHGFPREEAERLLSTRATMAAWRNRCRKLWDRMERVVLPRLDPGLSVDVQREHHSFVEAPPDFPLMFAHADLGPEHVLVGDRGARLSGIIDFESATIGDPAIDVLPLVRHLGRPLMPALLAGRAFGDDLERRLRFYSWMGSAHAILYGAAKGRPDIVAGGIEELRRRIRSPLAV